MIPAFTTENGENRSIILIDVVGGVEMRNDGVASPEPGCPELPGLMTMN